MTDKALAWNDFLGTVGELEALLQSAPAMAPEDRQRALLIVLNNLELAFLALPDVEPDGDEAQSPNTYDVRRSQVAAAFPEFGWYHHIRPSSATDAEEPGNGDAVDDLADILRGIDGALWEASAHGVDTGIWQAKFSYEHHIGSHLADLRSHVYRLRFFGP